MKTKQKESNIQYKSKGSAIKVAEVPDNNNLACSMTTRVMVNKAYQAWCAKRGLDGGMKRLY